MGWSSGSRLFTDLVNIINTVVSDDSVREELFEEFIPVFEEYDCDTLCECIGIDPILDRVLKDKIDIDEMIPYDDDEAEYGTDDYGED